MKTFLPFLFFAVLLVGCEKESSTEEKPAENPAETPVAVASILGTWKFDSFKDSANHQTSATPCLADNTLTFKPDSTALLSHGACRDQDFPLEANLGRWSVSKDQILSLDGRQRKIRQLTDSTLWFGEDTGDKIYEFRWKR